MQGFSWRRRRAEGNLCTPLQNRSFVLTIYVCSPPFQKLQHTALTCVHLGTMSMDLTSRFILVETEHEIVCNSETMSIAIATVFTSAQGGLSSWEPCSTVCAQCTLMACVHSWTTNYTNCTSRDGYTNMPA